ncbi:MAG: hypothetical protein ACI3XT_01790 [Butyricicoccaceae bacterium]
MKRYISLFLVFGLILSAAGCRSRTTADGQPALHTPDVPEISDEAQASAEDASDAAKEDTAEQPFEGEPEADMDSDTEEDPNADRKEYDADADAEVLPGADHSLRTEDGEPGPASEDASSGRPTGAEEENAAQAVTETVPAEEAENTGTAENGEAADTALDYYQSLLNERLGTLFECERFSVYWETKEEYRTVFKTSFEHQLIVDAGAYDVSAKLLAENLTVDDGWVERKDPGLIVKVVDSDLLGDGVFTTGMASAAREALKARPGWENVTAVKNDAVVLLSEELLGDQAMRTAAAVYLAKIMYPSLFEDTDADECLQLLTAEAYGSAASGIYVFVG